MSETVLEASRAGDWPRLLELLPKDPKSAEERDDWGRLPLHYAALQTPDTPLEVFRGLLAAYPAAGSAPIGWDEDEQLALDLALEKDAPEDVLAVLKEAAGDAGQADRGSVRLSAADRAVGTMEEGDEDEGWGEEEESPSGHESESGREGEGARDSESGRTAVPGHGSGRSPGAATASANPWLTRSSVWESSSRLTGSPSSGFADELRAEMKVRGAAGAQANGGWRSGGVEGRGGQRGAARRWHALGDARTRAAQGCTLRTCGCMHARSRMAHALHAWLPALCTGPLTRGGRLGLGLGLGLANPSPSPNPYQAFKEELTQTALYIVDEVEARIKTHKDEVIARLHAQQVALEASAPNTATRPQP